MKLLGPQANAAFGRRVGDERPFHPHLRRHFSKLWYLDIPQAEDALELLMIPDGCADLVWIDEAFHIFPPNYRARRARFRAGANVFGFRFALGAAPLWLGVPAAELGEDATPLADLNPRLDSKLHAARDEMSKALPTLHQVESALVKISEERPTVNACMVGIADLFKASRFSRGGLLADLQQLTNLSERSVRRETERFIGFGPKRLERVARFQRFLSLKWNQEYDDLISLAAAAGYADQSHLTREARALTGLTPKQLIALCYEQPPIVAKNRPDRSVM